MAKAIRPASVYVAECGDAAGNRYVKVGKAVKPLARLPSLQVGCPFEFDRVRFVLLSSEAEALRCERAIHRALLKYRLRGEWFFAGAGDEAAKLALSCFAEVIAAVAKRPVRVTTMDVARYEKARKFYENHFGVNRHMQKA